VSLPNLFKVRFSKSQRSIECSGSTTVLEAAQQAGIEIPFSCQGGTCHTCAVKCVGEIDQEEALALTADELAQGWVLTCVGKPLSDLTVDA
jgi:2Fe-2S type ferredoxin